MEDENIDMGRRMDSMKKILLILLVLFLLIQTPSALAAFTYDTKLTYQTTSWSNANPGNLSYTAGSGATLMILAIHTAAAQRTLGTPTFNQKSFTLIGRTIYTSSPEGGAELYYLYLSASDTGSAYTVSVPNAGTQAMSYQVSTYRTTGTPLYYINSTANGLSADPSNTLVSAEDGALYVDSLFDGNNSCPPARTGTLLYCNAGGTYTGSSQYNLQTTAASFALGFTISSNDWALITAVFHDHPAIGNYSTNMTNDATAKNLSSGSCGSGCHTTADAGTITISSPKSGLKANETGRVWVNITGAGTGDTAEWVGIFNGNGTSATRIGSSDGWTISGQSNSGTTNSFSKSALSNLSQNWYWNISQATEGTYSIYGWIRHGSAGSGAKGYKTGALNFTIYHPLDDGAYTLNMTSGTGKNLSAGSCGTTCHTTSSSGTATISSNVTSTQIWAGNTTRYARIWVNVSGDTYQDDAQWMGLFLSNSTYTNSITTGGFTINNNNFGDAINKNTRAINGLSTMNNNRYWDVTLPSTIGTYTVSGSVRSGSGNGTSYKLVTNNLTITVAYETTPPGIISNTNYVYIANNSIILLNATITDLESGVKNATVNISSLNSTINEAILTNISGFWINNTIIADRGETFGFKNLTITAYDNVSNVNNSINMTIQITKPDLSITNANISFSFIASVVEVGEVRENNNVTINATIFNSGHLGVNNTNVRFYDGSPGSNIIANVTIASLEVGESKNATINWTSIIGTHNISIKVDPDNDIPETDETNNNASKFINVSAWQKYYGNLAGGYLDLRDQERNSFKNWNISGIEGNIFVTSHTEFNFNNLTALGRNKNGTIAQGNFSRADELLNMTQGNKNATGFANNNISQLFSLDGTTPRNTTTFTVYGRNISNVSIVNSTNVLNFTSVENATFITGIFWDTTKDNGDGEYGDDGEDLVFIANINVSKVGFISSPHDYEVAIPSTLGKGGSVYFNVEFKN